jgi:hypothetical protein
MGSIVTRPPGHRRRLLAAEIVQALARLGGAAHRDVVCEAIAIARKRAGRAVSPRLRTDLTAAFAAYCDLNDLANGETPLFTLPFGRDSLRWALADQPGQSRAQSRSGRLSA